MREFLSYPGVQRAILAIVGVALAYFGGGEINMEELPRELGVLLVAWGVLRRPGDRTTIGEGGAR